MTPATPVGFSVGGGEVARLLAARAAIVDSELIVLHGAPHGGNVGHAGEFDAALLEFLGR